MLVEDAFLHSVTESGAMDTSVAGNALVLTITTRTLVRYETRNHNNEQNVKYGGLKLVLQYHIFSMTSIINYAYTNAFVHRPVLPHVFDIKLVYPPHVISSSLLGQSPTLSHIFPDGMYFLPPLEAYPLRDTDIPHSLTKQRRHVITI